MIRRAIPGDAAALTEVIRAAYAPYAAQGLDLPPVDEGIADDIRNNHVWVAVDGARVLGGIVLVLGETAHLANLAVHPDGGGRGLGRALIGTVCDAARAAGFDRIALATHAGMTGTRALYARLGWVETGQDGARVYMALQLNGKDTS